MSETTVAGAASADPLTASIDIDASAEELFAIYADAAAWPVWDPDLEAAGREGPFAAGGRGWIKPRGVPRTRVTITALEPGRAFVAETRLPFGRMRFEHRVEPRGRPGRGGVRVTHRVGFAGLLAPLYRRLLGARVARSLPAAMTALKRHAESGGRAATGGTERAR